MDKLTVKRQCSPVPIFCLRKVFRLSIFSDNWASNVSLTSSRFREAMIITPSIQLAIPAKRQMIHNLHNCTKNQHSQSKHAQVCRHFTTMSVYIRYSLLYYILTTYIRTQTANLMKTVGKADTEIVLTCWVLHQNKAQQAYILQYMLAQ